MGTFINNNRGKLSLIAIAVAFLLAWLASFIFPEHEKITNWLIFIACLFVVGRINFIHFSDDFDIQEEFIPGHDYDREVVPKQAVNSKPDDLLDADIKAIKTYIALGHTKEEAINAFNKAFGPGTVIESIPEINQTEIKMKDNKNPEAPKAEVTQKQPEIVIAPTFREESNSENTAPAPEPVDDGKPKPEGVKGYSLHNIHKRWRPMYQDVCSYAISTVKSESELDAVVNRWGNKNTKVRAGSNLVAYVVEHGLGNIRIPEAGFFEIK